MVEATITAMTELLGEEKSLLKQGDLSRMESISARKAVLLDELGQIVCGEDAGASLARSLAHIHKAAKENERLLNAALTGVQSAQKKLIDIRTKEAQIGAYGVDGRPLTITKGYQTKTKSV